MGPAKTLIRRWKHRGRAREAVADARLFAGGVLAERGDRLEVSHDVPADAFDALDDDAVGRVDVGQRRRVGDEHRLEETATDRLSGEDALAGRVVDVAARLAVNQTATHRLRERHRRPRNLHEWKRSHNLKVLRFGRTNPGDRLYRAANAVFGRVGRIASEEVVLHLILTKCIPILLYGLEACLLRKTDLNSLDFVVNRFFMKLFQTGNIDLVKCCQSFFCFELPSAIHDRRASKFDLRYRNHSNLFCQMISSL